MCIRDSYYTGHTWGDMRRYDLTLNSSTSGIAGAVELICALVRSRAAVEDVYKRQALNCSQASRWR